MIFVVGVTAAKDLYEDIKRHRSDKQLNNQLCTVIRNGTSEQVRATDVRVGRMSPDYARADSLARPHGRPGGSAARG